MSGTCWTGSASVVSGPPAGPSNATRRRSPVGGDTAGPPSKKARRESRTVVFIDESGLSTRPHRVRTWGRKGQTPVIQETFGWQSLSLIAGLTWKGFLFRMHAGSIKSEQVVEFLEVLLRHLPGPLLVVWDGAPIHRSKRVRDFAAGTAGRLVLERLPAYAPELNPVEYLWAHLKEHQLGNLLVRQAHELGRHATAALRRLRRRPKIIAACWKQSSLPLRPCVTLLNEDQ